MPSCTVTSCENLVGRCVVHSAGLDGPSLSVLGHLNSASVFRNQISGKGQRQVERAAFLC